MKINLLKQKVVALLRTVSGITEVYESGSVDKDATFPYLVYSISSSSEGMIDDTQSILFPLTIESYDYKTTKDTSTINDIVEAIDDALDRVDTIETDYYIEFIRSNVGLVLPTPDEYTFRRESVYQIKYNEK